MDFGSKRMVIEIESSRAQAKAKLSYFFEQEDGKWAPKDQAYPSAAKWQPNATINRSRLVILILANLNFFILFYSFLLCEKMLLKN